MIISWEKFTKFVWERLKVGAEEYGDKSFSKNPSVLIGEIKQEVADIMGWGFILWHRLCVLEKKLLELEEHEQHQGRVNQGS